MTTKRSRKRSSAPKVWQGFIQGAAGSMAGASVSHPLDLLKVRLQIDGELSTKSNKQRLGVMGMARHVVQTEGVRGLFGGLTASLFRQFFYSGVRFGMYGVLKDAVGVPGQELPLFQKIAAAASAGGIGALVANPGDLAMVRMQADGKLPAASRRNYKHVGDALVRVIRDEGLGRLWRGVAPTVHRAMIVTVGHLAAYDEAKAQLIRTGGFGDTIGTHFSASFFAACVASLLSHPVDVTKTRLMNMQYAQYRGMGDCMAQTVRVEGPLALYKGFTPTLIRQVPYVMVTWITVEQIKAAFTRFDSFVD